MAKTPADTVDITIRIEKSHAERLDEIVQALESSGVSNLDVHRRFLIVNGSVASDLINTIQKIDGVASVRKDQTYKPS